MSQPSFWAELELAARWASAKAGVVGWFLTESSWHLTDFLLEKIKIGGPRRGRLPAQSKSIWQPRALDTAQEFLLLLSVQKKSKRFIIFQLSRNWLDTKNSW
jgi:hypothetical protein